MAIDFERNLVMGLKVEAAYNEAIGTLTGYQGMTILPGARLSVERDIREEMSNRGKAAPSPYDMASGLRRWSFDFSMNMPKEALAHPLYYLFGAIVSTAITAKTSHVVSINDPALGTDPTPPSFKVRLLDDNFEWQLRGARVKSMEFVLQLDNFWRVNVSLIGGGFATATTGTNMPTFTTPASGRHYYTSDDCIFNVDASGSSGNWTATNFSVKFERNYAEGAEESYESGSAERIRLASAGAPAFMVTGSTRRLYDTNTQFNLFNGYSQFRIEAATKVNGSETVVPGTDGFAFRVALEKCVATAWDKEVAGGITLQKLDFRAMYDTLATDIQVTTQDTLSTPATAGTP